MRLVPNRGSLGVAMAWFRGDCHTHSTISSGGELTPAELVAAAQELGLDFVAATEHNTEENAAEWAALSGDTFLVIPGREHTDSPGGHWLSLGGQLRVVAHPHAPYPNGTFRHPLDDFDLIEVWNGAWRSDLWWQADNEAALHGWDPADHPAIGNSDIHHRGQLGEAHNVVRADRLTADAILDALRQGRSWIAGATSIDLSFEAVRDGVTAQIGDRLAGGPAEIRVDVRGVPGGTVSLHTEQGRIHEATEHVVAIMVDARLVRIEVRHPDGRMAAITNPIFIG